MQELDRKELKGLLQKTTKKIEASKDNIEINSIVEDLVTTLLGSEHASLWIFDETRAVLLRERDESSVREISMLDQRGIIAKSFLTVSGGIYNYLASEKEYVAATDNPDEIRIKSMIIAPIVDGDRFLGIVTAYSSIRQIKNFVEDDMEVLESLSKFLVNVIYYMHPQFREQQVERVYISERLKNGSQQVIKDVEKIQEAKHTEEAPDATLSFLANTVHDIRTPANSMYGFLELLEEQMDNPRLLQYVRNAKESAHFINELTTSILDRVSSQHERAASKPVALNPSKFFADIAENFSANMFNKSLDFNVYVDPLLPKEIIVDDMKLKRVVMNLIGNAYKFTPTHQNIEFSVNYMPEKQKIEISVKDTGIGIAKEKQDEIFKAFKQADEKTHAEFGGTGLGLSISAEYVRELGGELQLSSALDKGSTFYFEMPIKVSNPNPNIEKSTYRQHRFAILLEHHNVVSGHNLMRNMLRMGVGDNSIAIINSLEDIADDTTHLICFQTLLNAESIKAAQERSLKLLVVEEKLLSLARSVEDQPYDVISKYTYYADTLYDFIKGTVRTKVLVVDDDKINIELIKALLEDDFYHVEVAYDGLSALQKLKEASQSGEPFQLSYLDENMPGLSGTEVMTQFRDYEKKQGEKPVLAVSISGDPLRDKSKKSPFDLYVGKPFKKKEIKAVLEQLKKK